MTDITNVSSGHRYADDSSSSFQIKGDEKKEDVQEVKAKEKEKSDVNINELINELIQDNPYLKAAYNGLVEKYSGESASSSRNGIFRMMSALANMNQALNGLTIVYADAQGKKTEELKGYGKLKTQVPIITQGMGFLDDVEGKEEQSRALRGEINQKLATSAETIRATEGMKQEDSKRLNSIMQSLKDSAQATTDTMISAAELIQRESSKIHS